MRPSLSNKKLILVPKPSDRTSRDQKEISGSVEGQSLCCSCSVSAEMCACAFVWFWSSGRQRCKWSGYSYCSFICFCIVKIALLFNIPLKIIPKFQKQIVMCSYTHANITKDLIKLDLKLSDLMCDISVLNQFWSISFIINCKCACIRK
jgi:hypothetical protein